MDGVCQVLHIWPAPEPARIRPPHRSPSRRTVPPKPGPGDFHWYEDRVKRCASTSVQIAVCLTVNKQRGRSRFSFLNPFCEVGKMSAFKNLGRKLGLKKGQSNELLKEVRRWCKAKTEQAC